MADSTVVVSAGQQIPDGPERLRYKNDGTRYKGTDGKLYTLNANWIFQDASTDTRQPVVQQSSNTYAGGDLLEAAAVRAGKVMRGEPTGTPEALGAREQSRIASEAAARQQVEAQKQLQISNRDMVSAAGQKATAKSAIENQQTIANLGAAAGGGAAALQRKNAEADIGAEEKRADEARIQAQLRADASDTSRAYAVEKDVQGAQYDRAQADRDARNAALAYNSIRSSIINRRKGNSGNNEELPPPDETLPPPEGTDNVPPDSTTGIPPSDTPETIPPYDVNRNRPTQYASVQQTQSQPQQQAQPVPAVQQTQQQAQPVPAVQQTQQQVQPVPAVQQAQPVSAEVTVPKPTTTSPEVLAERGYPFGLNIPQAEFDAAAKQAGVTMTPNTLMSDQDIVRLNNVIQKLSPGSSTIRLGSAYGPGKQRYFNGSYGAKTDANKVQEQTINSDIRIKNIISDLRLKRQKQRTGSILNAIMRRY